MKLTAHINNSRDAQARITIMHERKLVIARLASTTFVRTELLTLAFFGGSLLVLCIDLIVNILTLKGGF